MQENEKILYFADMVHKTLKQMCFEKLKIGLVELVEKYNLSKSVKNQIEKNFIDCNITDVYEILDILDISLYDFAVMLERELGEDFKYFN